MDRSVFSFIEPLLHNVAFMGWNSCRDQSTRPSSTTTSATSSSVFQIAYGVGFLFAGRIIDKLGTKIGYALAILHLGDAPPSATRWSASSPASASPRIFLGLGESGNFPAAIKATTEWFPSEERAKAVGLFNSGSNASAFIAPLLIAAVTAHPLGLARRFHLPPARMGLLWLVVWLFFPYNKLRRGSTQTQANLGAAVDARAAPSTLGTSPAPRNSMPSLSAKASPTPSGGSTSSISQVPERQLRPGPQARHTATSSPIRDLHRRLDRSAVGSPAALHEARSLR